MTKIDKVMKYLAKKQFLNPCFYVMLFALLGCTKALDIDLPEPPPTLVVDGFVSDQNKVYTVKLSRAAVFAGVRDAGGNPTPVEDALVTVSDDIGNTYEFANNGAGFYRSDSTVFNGEVGRTYTLEILVDGKMYRSTPETITSLATFDDFEHVATEREVLSFSGRLVSRDGFDLLVSYTLQDHPDVYVRWAVSYFIDRRPIINEAIKVVSRSELTMNNVSGMSVDFVYARGSYEAIVEMHTLSPKAYTFWELGQRQQENGGTLFESAPIEVIGNMSNVDDPDEQVFGLFSAASVTTKRAFFYIN